jgi:DMSO reductase family type II enzyme heme b subunit
MMRFLKHPLFLSLLTVGIVYGVFAYLVYPPIPKSLLVQYMVIVTVGVLLVASFDNKTADRLVAPLISLMGDPKLWPVRTAALLAVMLGAGFATYTFIKPSSESPLELRTVHPAPPSTLRVYDKSYNLLTLENPLRAEFPEGTDGFEQVVADGAQLYAKNCIFCHGDLLDGQGVFSRAFSPRPANFQDVGTIAQLQESYLFWRITTGGPGLPVEGTPWASAMPVWQEMLTEDEVWKLITFLYDYTGHVPRSWELAETPVAAEPETSGGVLDEDAVEAIYQKRCAVCHGREGEGDGPAADFLYPKPRDFSLAVFKYKSTESNSEFPSDEDFRKTIREGLTGTTMPAWKTILSDAEIDALILKIKQLGYWDEEEIAPVPIDLGTMPEVTDALLANGQALFKKNCSACHGLEGRGNITSGKRLADDAKDRIWPRNLTRPETWRFTASATNVFQRLSTGIPSTPMPEFATNVSVEDRWAIAQYVMTLRNSATQLNTGDTVIRAMRVAGDLPDTPDSPLWQTAPALTVALSPNIIKEPRLFVSLNDTVTVRVLYNDTDIAFRVDVDDRTYSVPGDELEARYAIDGVTGTRDAIAVQLPTALTGSNKKPWFRHGNPDNAVNMWYWSAPSVTDDSPEQAILLDAAGPDKPPVPRPDSSELSATGKWENGRWQVVFTRALETGTPADFQFSEGEFIPVAFANWDGVAGQTGGRHSLSTWYWVLLEPAENPTRLYGIPAGSGALAGLLFVLLARRTRRRFAV